MATVRGTLVDSRTKRGIAFVLVALDGRTDATDDKGIFEIMNVPPGTYTLRAKPPFYEWINKQVTIGEEDKDLGVITLRSTVI